MENVVGYFTYPTGTVPNVDNIQKVLAFPNATPINKIVENERVGALLCGHEVKLKYWNSENSSLKISFLLGSQSDGVWKETGLIKVISCGILM